MSPPQAEAIHNVATPIVIKASLRDAAATYEANTYPVMNTGVYPLALAQPMLWALARVA